MESVQAPTGLSSTGGGAAGPVGWRGVRCGAPGRGRRSNLCGLSALATLFVFACTAAPARDLAELTVRDSTYLAPETMLPYSGRVTRHLPEEEGGLLLLEATLRDGTWEGEFTIYHSTGRIRYQGEMSGGARCGAWTENENPVEPENVYDAIKEDIESIVMFPECPEK